MGRRPSGWLALFLLLLGLTAAGTAGYALIEGWSLLDALYMTVISLTTVGYGEVRPLSPAGRFFTIVLLVAGIGLVSSIVTHFARLLIEGGVRNIMEHRRMQRDIEALADHVIVCGLSRTGVQVVDELVAAGLPLVLIERGREVIEAHPALPRIPWITGDAREDEVLLAAGIARARAIVVCLMDDADNVFITLSARQLNPRVSIVAQANLANSESKLRTAGANRVISLNTIGGRRLAATVLRPGVVDFLDVITSGETGLEIAEIPLATGSPLIQQSLAETGIRRRSGAIILAIKHNGQFAYNPDPQRKLAEGDVLLALGDAAQIDKLQEIAIGGIL